MKYIEVNLLGKVVEVKPDFAFVDRVEQRFDLLSFVRSMETGKPRMGDVAWILTCALRCGGVDDVDYIKVGNEVLSNQVDCFRIAGELVRSVLSAGPEKKQAPPEMEELEK